SPISRSSNRGLAKKKLRNKRVSLSSLQKLWDAHSTLVILDNVTHVCYAIGVNRNVTLRGQSMNRKFGGKEWPDTRTGKHAHTCTRPRDVFDAAGSRRSRRGGMAGR